MRRLALRSCIRRRRRLGGCLHRRSGGGRLLGRFQLRDPRLQLLYPSKQYLNRLPIRFRTIGRLLRPHNAGARQHPKQYDNCSLPDRPLNYVLPRQGSHEQTGRPHDCLLSTRLPSPTPTQAAHELKFRLTVNRTAVGARIRTRISKPRPKLMWYPVKFLSSREKDSTNPPNKGFSPRGPTAFSNKFAERCTNNCRRLSRVSGQAFRRAVRRHPDTPFGGACFETECVRSPPTPELRRRASPQTLSQRTRPNARANTN